MKLELAIMAGSESKQWLAELTKQLDRLEELLGKARKVGMSPALGEGYATDTVKPPSCEMQTHSPDDDDEDGGPEEDDTQEIEVGPGDDDAEDEEIAGEDIDAGPEDDDEEEEPIPAPKKKVAVKAAPVKAKAAPPVKGKKSKEPSLTAEHCNAAAKALFARMKGTDKAGRIKAIIKKNFKTESITDLPPEHYSKFIEVMKSAQ